MPASRLSPLATTLLRVMAGIALVAHGWPKIQNPFGAADMVASLGFVPGAFWSLALSLTEFVGGILIIIGLFTRPAALAATVVLLVTVYFHWIRLGQGYSGAELSLIWASVTFWLFAHGGGRWSADAAIGRQF